MKKIIRTHILGMLIIAAVATHSNAFVYDMFRDYSGRSGTYIRLNNYEVDLLDILKDGSFGRNGIEEVYVNKQVEKKIRTTVTGSFFKKTKTQDVFYIGHIYVAVRQNGDLGYLLQYDDYLVIVPEKEHKLFVIKKTVNNDKGSIVTESHENEWQNLDWSKIEEIGEGGGKLWTLSRCINEIKELGAELSK